MISHVLFTSEEPTKNKMAFVGIILLSQIKLLSGLLVIQPGEVLDPCLGIGVAPRV